MVYILLNALPILMAAAVSVIFGLGFYALVGRGGEFRRLRLLGIAFGAEAWIAAILAGALILAPEEAGAWTMAIGTAVIIWVGFVAPALLITGLHRKLPLSGILTDLVHWLAVMLLQVGVMEVWGLTPPPGV